MARNCWFGPIAGVTACVVALILVLGVHAPAAAQEPLNHDQAVQALDNAEATRRLEGMIRLADIGTAADSDVALARLRDDDPVVRRFAVVLVWRVWGRSGDAAIDALYEQGVALMQAGELSKAVLLFSDIIAKRPQFAEAWNKRATLLYMLDQYDLSMKDCDEVLKRVPQHFGALSGYAQMLAESGQPERALELFERAYKVNPNMANAELVIQDLRQQIEAKRKKST
ncbi:MAG: tetratricopeptide repeat protein [Burkholderiaceae bacterium]